MIVGWDQWDQKNYNKQCSIHRICGRTKHPHSSYRLSDSVPQIWPDHQINLYTLDYTPTVETAGIFLGIGWSSILHKYKEEENLIRTIRC